MARCVGPRGRHPELPIARTHAGATRAMRETGEVLALVRGGEALPLDGVAEVRPSVDRAERGGALDGPALRDVARTLGAARALRRFLSRRRDALPALAAACPLDPTLDEVADTIDGAVEPDGRLSDRASPDLRRLRGEVANLRAKIVHRLEQLLVDEAALLQDSFFTIREGRFVVPVRSDAHERVPGIVHGSSSSGASIYVEPRAVVTLGNRWKVAQGELEREEARILAELTDRVRERAAEVRAAADALDHADLRQASARLARDLDARVPDLVDAPRMRLVGVRHPVLCLELDAVVPNDLAVEGGQGLVISGPNAGGKTVALKTLGLAALMVRAGLPLPTEEGSVCGLFQPVWTDVGDDQSLDRKLSSFSAHVTNLAGMLRDVRPGSLVLLDELAGSTDPEEGAALAGAVVEGLRRRGAAVAVTTHYEGLKALALRDPGLRNASVGFDVARMEPTFRLTLDQPGVSSALVVAERYGIPDDVLDAARRGLSDRSRSFDELVHALEAQRVALDRERDALRAERDRVDGLRAKVEAELDALRAREKAALTADAEKLASDVRHARKAIRDARKRLRRAEKAEDAAAVEEAAVAVRKAADAAAAAAERARPADAGAAPEAAGPALGADDPVSVGHRVYVPRLQARAQIIEAPSKGRVRVAVGAMKLWVELSELRDLGEAPARREERPSALASEPDTPAPPARLPPPGPDNTVDVRGLRVDDALSMVDAFLDRLYGASEPAAYVLHGVGSGALRDAIRAHLRQARDYVRQLRPGSLEEGGDRLTVVTLR